MPGLDFGPGHFHLVEGNDAIWVWDQAVGQPVGLRDSQLKGPHLTELGHFGGSGSLRDAHGFEGRDPVFHFTCVLGRQVVDRGKAGKSTLD